MNDPKITIDILKSKNLFISLEGEYFLGETQRCLSGDWNLYLKDDRIYLEDDKEIIIVDKQTELSPRMWGDSFFVVKEKGVAVEEKYYYRGAVNIDIENDNIEVQNIVDVDFFISSILDRRFAANDQFEFLKAMVIVYRSYMVKYINELNTTSFIKEKTSQELLLYLNNFISPKPEQLEFKYKGISIEGNEILRKAVEDTKGDVLFYNSQIVALPYTFCCGGIPESIYYHGNKGFNEHLNTLKDTETRDNVGSLNKEEVQSWIYHPEDFYCKTQDPEVIDKMISDDIGDRNKLFRWRVEVELSKLADILKNKFNYNIVELKDFIIEERNDRGTVQKVNLINDQEEIEISEQNLMLFAAYLKLPSLAFISKLITNENKVVFVGAGKGHRAGLCMVGAMAMSKAGKNMNDIINHYYSDVYIAKQY